MMPWDLSRLPRVARALSNPPMDRTPHDVVLTENKYRLLRFWRPPPNGVPSEATGHPVLLVPSLINRWYVLDLLPEQSFAADLVGRGHDVFVIDWGTPGPEDRYLGLEHYVDRYIGRAVRTACRLAGAPRAHLLGYCLGGTLTAMHAALFPERVASMVALAAPIAFREGGLLATWMNAKSLSVDKLAAGFGNIPWPLMQAAFLMMKPTMQLSKFRSMLERGGDDGWLRVFAAIETWGSDNVSFAGQAWREYIEDLYRHDRLVEGGLSLGGREVRLSSITCPVMAVSFGHDHIVPEASARRLLELVGSTAKVDLVLPGGHVGAVIGKRAKEELWEPVSNFYRRHEPLAPSLRRSEARAG